MSSSILHQCPQCGHVSDISNALAAFIENPHCTQCGLSASESNQKVQDELASLFERQMSMTQFVPPVSDSVGSLDYPHSIEQHYQSPQLDQNPIPHSSVDVLRYHGLDPHSLTASQLELFENADAEQKERLIQTWQLYSQIGATDHSKDFAMEDSTMDEGDENTSAEPYMISGYQHSSLPTEPTTGEPYAGSKDPAYQSQQWWELTKGGPIESGYGAFEETRRYYPSCGVYRC
ncbi:hypothetical protein N7541_008229 [Penicillium brevicompactum]|uniref:Uncharacterized protein n=1 Tax=Penicillium brevicompactum TaxID=5074 RepID=A0A9W9UML7_PENBR|nr:uncharacterized protein N7506_003341 [Penicillium brevicompactum]KAJ5343517.1 hypothetical protein N7506_003341 [Penicillium brevicompactum]KAJ5350502.1 hypothetical protein N7541_008229 [Penicillium brevicompactum]